MQCLRGYEEVRKARVMRCGSIGRVTPRHERIAFDDRGRDHLYNSESRSL
jgi:hypothetical protein